MASRPKLPRTVWILGIVSLLMDLSSEIYHALLPAFLTVTLGLPVVAMGAIDGISEGIANISKIVSGRLSDRHRRRKPWIVFGYGLAAFSKPLFPLAQGALPVMGARFVDRIGKGIRGAPRDAMIADETPPELRGAAYGLRQALDTIGGTIAPLAAIGLMFLFADDIRMVFWIAAIPAFLSFLFAWAMLKEPEVHRGNGDKVAWAGWRSLDKQVKRLIGVGFLFGLARFSESFLILKALDAGLAPAWSPLALAMFSLSFMILAYPAGSLSDRMEPKTVLLSGIATLIAANLWLANVTAIWAVFAGIALWGAHMALTQGIFARMIADAAPSAQRATSFGAFFFASGVATVLASVGAGWLWDRGGPAETFTVAAGVAALAMAMLWLLPVERRQASAST
jgi:MFS family permease